MAPPLCGSTAMSHNEFKKIREPIEPQEVSPMKQEITVLGIDLAKHVLHAVGMDNTGKIVFRKRVSRHDLMPCIARSIRRFLRPNGTLSIIGESSTITILDRTPDGLCRGYLVIRGARKHPVAEAAQ